jgi:hypothetical protein
VGDARQQEQASEPPHGLRPAHPLGESVAVGDRPVRGDRLVRPTAPKKELPARGAKGPKAGVGRVVDARPRSSRGPSYSLRTISATPATSRHEHPEAKCAASTCQYRTGRPEITPDPRETATPSHLFPLPLVIICIH